MFGVCCLYRRRYYRVLRLRSRCWSSRGHVYNYRPMDRAKPVCPSGTRLHRRGGAKFFRYSERGRSLPFLPPPHTPSPPPIPTTTTTTTTATSATTTPPPINSRVHGQGNWRDPARQLGVRLGPGQQYTTMTPHRESGSKVSDASQLPAPSLTCERQPVSTENAGHLTCSCLFPSCASVGLVGAVFKETGPIHTLSV